MFYTNLKYPESLINSIISHFVTSMMTKDPLVPPQLPVNEDTVHRVVLPFKDQTSADAVKKQLSDLSKKIDHILQPAYIQESQNLWRSQDAWTKTISN